MTRLPRIAEIREGAEGWGFFLCTRKETRPTRSGVPLISLGLQDASGEIGAVIFDQGSSGLDDFEPGEFVKVQARGNRHHQRLGLVIEAIRRVNPVQDHLDGFREEDCIPCAPRALDDMWGELQRRLEGVENHWIRQLLTDVVERNTDRLRTWPAAVTVHHAYRGGLLEHILALASLGDAFAALYGVERDLLLAGAILHDIGKLEELEYDGATTYSRDGNLLGHIAIGVTMVRAAVERLEGFPADVRARIEHMIVSHHGSREHGSPVEPMTEEAFILSAIDDLDARLHQVRHHLHDGVSEGEFTPYHPRLKRVLFRRGDR
ncbi:HD domain-containing protein [soil metagenome]